MCLGASVPTPLYELRAPVIFFPFSIYFPALFFFFFLLFLLFFFFFFPPSFFFLLFFFFSPPFFFFFFIMFPCYHLIIPVSHVRPSRSLLVIELAGPLPSTIKVTDLHLSVIKVASL